jgi:hypothetical protein
MLVYLLLMDDVDATLLPKYTLRISVGRATLRWGICPSLYRLEARNILVYKKKYKKLWQFSKLSRETIELAFPLTL